MTLLLRIGANAILFLSVFVMPWWCTALLTIGAIFFFSAFYESLVVGLLLDSLYGVSGHAWGYMCTITAHGILIASFSIKRRLKFY